MRIHPNVFSKTIGGQEVLVHMETGFYFGMDDVATTIWQGFKNGESKESIVQTICQKFDVEPAEVEADLEDFLAALKEEDLISEP